MTAKLDLSGADSLRWMSPDATHFYCCACKEEFEVEEAAALCFAGEEVPVCCFCGSEDLEEFTPSDEDTEEAPWINPPF